MSDPTSSETFTVKLGQVRQADLNEETFLLALICAYVILVPTLSFVPSLDPYNEKRAIQIGILLVVAGGLLVLRSARQRWLEMFRSLPLAARWGLGGVLILGGLSSALAPAPFYAFLEAGHFALLFVAAGVVALEVRRAPRWTQRALFGVVAVSGGLYAVYFAVGYGAHLAVADIKLWPGGGTNYANIRFFNHYQTWTLPLLAGGFLSLPKRWRVGKVLVFALIVLWWALVLASNVRGTIVAVLTAAIGVGLLFQGRSKKWVSVLAASLIGGIALYSLLFYGQGPPPVVDKFGDPSQYPWRIQRWMSSLEMAWAHPWIGAGPMHFAWPPYRFATGASPHNALLQWLAEWGIPSTLIMGSIAIWGGWSWMQQEREATTSDSGAADGMSVALVASVLAGAAHAMVSGLIVAPLSQMLLVLVGGSAWGRYRPKYPDSDSAPLFRAHILLSLLLIGSVSVVGSSLQDLTIIRERRSALIESAQRSTLSPRYWTQGFIGVRDPEVIERAR